MPNQPLELVFVPSLVATLLHHERQKGQPLTQSEVESIRDKAACIAMPLDVAAEVHQARGYPDINPEHCWAQWQEVRLTLQSSERP